MLKGRVIKTSLTLEPKVLTTMISYFRGLAKEDVRAGGLNPQKKGEVVRESRKKWARKGRKTTQSFTPSFIHYVLIPDLVSSLRY